MITGPIQEFISTLKESGKIPNIIPEYLGNEIFYSANINSPTHESPGNTALALAAATGDLSLVQALIDLGADTQKVNGAYQSFLQVAAQSGQLEIVDLALSQMTAEGLTLTDYDGNNVLHFACENGDPKIIVRLLQDARLKSLIHQKNLYGSTAIDIAIANGNDEAILLLNPNIRISELTNYGKIPPDISQENLEAKLTNYLNLTAREEERENVIFKFGMCNGWSWLRQVYLTQGKEDEYLALLTLIATWDGTQQGLARQDLPLLLKHKYQKIFADRVEPGDVAFVFENFIHNLSLSFASTQIFEELNLGILQEDRAKQYDLLKSSTDQRVLKNIFNVPFNNYNKSQLIEIFEFLTMYPGMSIDINIRSHAVTLHVTPEGLLNYYDSGLKSTVDHFMLPEELASHILKTDTEVDFKLSAFKFYEPSTSIPEIELPIGRSSSIIPSPNGYTPLHLAILQNNPQKVIQLLSESPQDLHAQDAHGYTPLKLALRAYHPACIVALLSNNENKPITHSDEIDFQRATDREYEIDLSSNPFKILFDPKNLCIKECVLIKSLMEQGEISFNFTDRNGLALSEVLKKIKDESNPQYKELEQFIYSQNVLANQNENRKKLTVSYDNVALDPKPMNQASEGLKPSGQIKKKNSQ